jgi:hypothetical protein
MKYILEDYLDYIQDSNNQGAGFLLVGGLMYAAYKNWKSRHEIVNGYCRKEKGNHLKLEICIAEVQIKNSKEIINQIEKVKHTCEETTRPQRCYEKVRYYLRKYNDKIVHLNKRIHNLKLKLSEREYKRKMKMVKQKYQK